MRVCSITSQAATQLLAWPALDRHSALYFMSQSNLSLSLPPLLRPHSPHTKHSHSYTHMLLPKKSHIGTRTLGIAFSAKRARSLSLSQRARSHSDCAADFSSSGPAMWRWRGRALEAASSL